MVDLPLNQDSMVVGNDYFRPDAPSSDAASLAGSEMDRIPDLPQGYPSPLASVSLATTSDNAPEMGAFLLTNLHDVNYLDPTKPHISPESQKG